MLDLKTMPEILTHPNIPKPLHGLNPRTIMGQEAWDVTRQQVYAQSNYYCVACGVHKSQALGPKWLEAHEYYKFDYANGRIEIEKIVALCHYCHNFIHSGRLQMIMGKEKTEEECKAILERGFEILSENDLKCFYGTFDFALELKAWTFGVLPAMPPECDVEWSDWRLVYEGKEYKPIFNSYEEWLQHYSQN